MKREQNVVLCLYSQTQMPVSVIVVIKIQSCFHSFLQLVWTFPTSSQAGSYKCVISGVTGSGHLAPLLTQALEVKAASVSVEDMVS